MPWLRTRFGILVYICWLQLAVRSTRIAAYSNQEGISLLTGVSIHISLCSQQVFMVFECKHLQLLEVPEAFERKDDLKDPQ
jgi:hypothetical protein